MQTARYPPEQDSSARFEVLTAIAMKNAVLNELIVPSWTFSDSLEEHTAPIIRV
jgi:hypothetical protein